MLNKIINIIKNVCKANIPISMIFSAINDLNEIQGEERILNNVHKILEKYHYYIENNSNSEPEHREEIN